MSVPVGSRTSRSSPLRPVRFCPEPGQLGHQLLGDTAFLIALDRVQQQPGGRHFLDAQAVGTLDDDGDGNDRRQDQRPDRPTGRLDDG